MHGRYPEDVVADLALRGVRLPVPDGDLETINAQLDSRVDYATQRGVPKRSAHWYRDTIRRVRG